MVESYSSTSSSAAYSSNLVVPTVDLESPPPHPGNIQQSLHRRGSQQQEEIPANSQGNPPAADSGEDIAIPSYVISISGGGGNDRGVGGRHPRIMITNSDGEASTSGGASRTRQSFELFYGGSPQISNTPPQETGTQVGAETSSGGHGMVTSSRMGANNSSMGENNTLQDNEEENEETGSAPSNSSTESDENVSGSLGGSNNSSENPHPAMRIGNSVTFIIRSGSHERTLLLMGQNRKRTNAATPDIKINKNRPRLTHFVEEPNVGRGFIKEVCFSNDGRLICSPFGYGVRLLSFDPACSELCDNVPSQPMQLHELTSNMSHSNTVVTTKFSPTHNLLVSGCLNGKVDFHQPIL